MYIVLYCLTQWHLDFYQMIHIHSTFTGCSWSRNHLAVGNSVTSMKMKIKVVCIRKKYLLNRIYKNMCYETIRSWCVCMILEELTVWCWWATVCKISPSFCLNLRLWFHYMIVKWRQCSLWNKNVSNICGRFDWRKGISVLEKNPEKVIQCCKQGLGTLL